MHYALLLFVTKTLDARALVSHNFLFRQMVTSQSISSDNYIFPLQIYPEMTSANTDHLQRMVEDFMESAFGQLFQPFFSTRPLPADSPGSHLPLDVHRGKSWN
jgi:hypothetical protein